MITITRRKIEKKYIGFNIFYKKVFVNDVHTETNN